MSKKPKTVRGMNDILPDVAASWQHLESEVENIIEAYGYQQVRLPLLEHTEVFRRSIGEVTDIVEKEMYTFDDGGDSLTLRPEATASMVRAGITHGLFTTRDKNSGPSGRCFGGNDRRLAVTGSSINSMLRQWAMRAPMSTQS